MSEKKDICKFMYSVAGAKEVQVKLLLQRR